MSGNAGPPLIEERPIADVFISGIGRVEKLADGMVRIVFYVERQDDAANTERVLAARLVCPIATWPQALRTLKVALGEADMVFVAEDGEVKAMH